MSNLEDFAVPVEKNIYVIHCKYTGRYVRPTNRYMRNFGSNPNFSLQGLHKRLSGDISQAQVFTRQSDVVRVKNYINSRWNLCVSRLGSTSTSRHRNEFFEFDSLNPEEDTLQTIRLRATGMRLS